MKSAALIVCLVLAANAQATPYRAGAPRVSVSASATRLRVKLLRGDAAAVRAEVLRRTSTAGLKKVTVKPTLLTRLGLRNTYHVTLEGDSDAVSRGTEEVLSLTEDETLTPRSTTPSSLRLRPAERMFVAVNGGVGAAIATGLLQQFGPSRLTTVAVAAGAYVVGAALTWSWMIGDKMMSRTR